MARKRMIDPEFFLDEDLAKLSAHARLLYIGSWGIADDNSFTFPHRPEWIKAQIFPYEKISIGRLLDELLESGHYILFTAEDNEQYIFIKNMSKHQRIEKPSKQKYPHYELATSRGIVGNQSGNTPAEEKLSKEKLSKDNILVELFNSTTTNLPKISQISKSREIKISKRLKDQPDLEWWKSVFLKADKILIKDWRPSFDWLIENDKNALKVYEGNYKIQQTKSEQLDELIKQRKEKENAV